MRKIIIGLATAAMLLGGTVAAAGTASAEASRCSGWSNNEPLLKAGATGDAVKALQCELNYSLNPNGRTQLVIDGVFGQATYNSVITFQQCMKNLQVDGEVGPQTWAALDYWTAQNGYPTC
ncbi:peptidoglycan-binding domain-containing protein [Streptomyces sp. SP17BM10]|uniref:peptidoglycan-binding domain-containing protein n=1 Tax=Streptomyces sp. SP17BM10 TaxID=3002530 RepID=UPI002E775143|nr:peptidoglycan-binding domain-containing protein [Streptomyces sp. SP17BM10]MEE1782125.1 peptidoglycan-binding domain-containing protein [Streptomyces sp. SP17BM10]